MSVPCHQAAAECFSPSCGSRAGMRATVFADIWEGVYVLMPVWIHTQRLWMELIQAGPPRSACASRAATWVVPQPHHRPDEMSPSDTITHPRTSKKTPQYEKSYRNQCRVQSKISFLIKEIRNWEKKRSYKRNFKVAEKGPTSVKEVLRKLKEQENKLGRLRNVLSEWRNKISMCDQILLHLCLIPSVQKRKSSAVYNVVHEELK